ncbi:ATP-binding cassette domain-containing protein [soil metagenome]
MVTRTAEAVGEYRRQAERNKPYLSMRDVTRTFEKMEALSHVSLEVRGGEIRALLGPNGAGKTTLLRILGGLVEASSGFVEVLGQRVDYRRGHDVRRGIGFIPSGDRTFYLRLSGLDNLAFFGRLYGLSRKEALKRGWQGLEAVGLTEAAKKPVGIYSHGMHKRLSVARALLPRPRVLLVDEATHDLDPEGSRRVRDLVSDIARQGAAVVWTTQRVQEIAGLASHVTLLAKGHTRFDGPLSEFVATQERQSFTLRIEGLANAEDVSQVDRALGDSGGVSIPVDGVGDRLLLWLSEGVTLGEAVNRLTAQGIVIVACSEEVSELEEAFLRFVGGGSS